MTIQHIATAAIYVEDPAKALQFWTEQVGFELRDRRPMGPNAEWIEVAPPGAQSALVLYPKAITPDWWSSRTPSLVFTATDIEATCDDLAARGVHFVKALADMPWGRFASFEDTEGNEIGIRG